VIKLLLRLQELMHHLSLGDHKLLLNGHIGRRWWSVTPTCTKTIGGSPSLSHHLKFMRFSLATYSQACLQHPQEEYAKRKLITSFGETGQRSWVIRKFTTPALNRKNSRFWSASAKFSKLQH
jgi:hypothetical protein